MAGNRHIFLDRSPESERFSPVKGGGGSANIPDRPREEHSAWLQRRFRELRESREQLGQQREAEHVPTHRGTYLSFVSQVRHDLVAKSLEDNRAGIRLLTIQQLPDSQTRATVYVPHGKENHFIKKVEEYSDPEKQTKTGKAKNQPLVNSIEDVGLALVESLWTDHQLLMPTETSRKWCEIWLRVDNPESDGTHEYESFKGVVEGMGLSIKSGHLLFPERLVVLVEVNKRDLVELMYRSDMLAEFRAGQELAGFWARDSRIEQQGWIDNLLSRLSVVDNDLYVCVLDSGVNEHPLLSPLLNESDVHTVKSDWGKNDHCSGAGHGTLVAGLAAYGDVQKALDSTGEVVLNHRLCSVKIIPPPHRSEDSHEELWGYFTQQAVSRIEIDHYGHRVIHCLTVSSKSQEFAEDGKPSSWSAALDKIAFGDEERKYLFIVSAGNVKSENYWEAYPQSNYRLPIHNPGQSWNALVVGAFTEKTRVNDQRFDDATPLAQEGELSPLSSTSRLWDVKKWPIKPDVVFEGGNLMRFPDGSVDGHEDLELLSTSKQVLTKPLATINATSAAAGQAAAFAAEIANLYPQAWPETIRALIVHSAQWTQAMYRQAGGSGRSGIESMLRTYGFGVPDLTSALYNKDSAFTFVIQQRIQPYAKTKGVGLNEAHFYALPWPDELLLELGNVDVKLRITLSYFIEPGEGRIGWKDKYRYPSHALRFELSNNEELDVFRKRVNKAAREEDEMVSSDSGSNRWTVGAQRRHFGSIHSDIWEGTAAGLSQCNIAAVYPIGGWWKERTHLKRYDSQVRYSLVLSLETPVEEIQLYQAVLTKINVPVEIEIDTRPPSD